MLVLFVFEDRVGNGGGWESLTRPSSLTFTSMIVPLQRFVISATSLENDHQGCHNRWNVCGLRSCEVRG